MAESLKSQIVSRPGTRQYKMYDFEYDVDPDSHVFSHINDKCEYCKEEQFKDNSEVNDTFSKGVDFQIMGDELHTGLGHKLATDPYQHTQIV